MSELEFYTSLLVAFGLGCCLSSGISFVMNKSMRLDNSLCKRHRNISKRHKSR